MIENVLQEEVRELVGARRYQRLTGRKHHRNGTYLRRLLTAMGLIEVTVPRARENGAPTEVIGRYRRRTAEVDRLVTSAYVEGVSTRDMNRLTEALMGEGISRSTVSRVTKVLGEQVEALRREPIEGPVPYLYLDATFLDARWARQVKNVAALVAYGAMSDGHRRLLGVLVPGTSPDKPLRSALQFVERRLTVRFRLETCREVVPPLLDPGFTRPDDLPDTRPSELFKHPRPIVHWNERQENVALQG